MNRMPKTLVAALLMLVSFFMPAQLFGWDIEPTLVTNYPISGGALNLAISSNYACVVERTRLSWNHIDQVADELVLIDITKPSRPERQGVYGVNGNFYGVAVSGQYAYLTEQPHFEGTNYIGGGLQIVDISDPANPRLVGRYDMESSIYPREVTVSGCYAYVADATWAYGDTYYELGTGGMHVIDVSDARNPKRVGGCGPDGYEEIVVAGRYAYAAGARGLDIIDINNPANPQIAGRSYAGCSAVGIAMAGQYVCVTELVWRHLGSRGSVATGRVQMIDISDPTNPRRIGGHESGVAKGISLSGTNIWVADEAGLLVLDVSTPEKPRLTGRYSTAGAALGIAIVGRYAYVPVGEGLNVIDMLSPCNPQRVSVYDIDGGAQDVEVSGSVAYVAQAIAECGDTSDRCYYVTGGLHMISISDLTNPKSLGSYRFSGGVLDVAVSNNYAYLAESTRGVEVIDVSDPMSPRAVSRLTFTDPAGYLDDVTSVEISGDYAYIAIADRGPNPYPVGGGLQVVDISNPAQLRHAGGYATVGNAVSLAILDTYAYVATEKRWIGQGNYAGGGLQIFDISNPTDPRLAGSFAADGISPDIAVRGSYAYLASWMYGGLRVIDVSNPARPVEVGSYAAIAGSDFAVSGGYAYIIGGGLQIVDIRDPTSLPKIGGNPNVQGCGITVANNKVFVAGAGLTVAHAYEPIRFERIANEGPGSTRLRVSGPPGVPGRLQRSGDLRTWRNWLPVNFGESPVEILDLDGNSESAGFYRLAVP